jgi:hypothetical protein
VLVVIKSPYLILDAMVDISAVKESRHSTKLQRRFLWSCRMCPKEQDEERMPRHTVISGSSIWLGNVTGPQTW